MKKLPNSLWLPAALSGLLTYISICHINPVICWIGYIPLFMAVYDKSEKQTFMAALVFGFTFSCFAFYWMIPGAERFTGSGMLYGLGVFVLCAVFYTLFCGAVFYCFSVLKNPDRSLRAIVLNSLLAASLITVAEALLTLVSTGLPWFDIHSGNGLAADLYGIQPASAFGMHLLSFIVVAVNYLAALIAVKKMWASLYIPAACVAGYLFTGFLLFRQASGSLEQNPSFKVAILAENIPPDIKWDDKTGNMLVQQLLDLNRQTVTLKPEVALWSESAIPWTYRENDDLVQEILRITDPARVMHIMGINTAWKDNVVFNSAYCMLPGGKVIGRYDKQYLLSFIEKPLNGWLMPFFSSNGYSALSDKEHGIPVPTPYGSAGMLICNEAALPAAAASQVKHGATFLMNMSNDGWFSDTYIVRLHFYYARLRAVESRRDMAVNSNNGFSGLIKASGEIVEKERSTEPFVKLVAMQPNSYITFATSYPAVFMYACVIYLALYIFLLRLKNVKESKSML